ncbi:acyltransferase [Citromicrobium bathyomarinum]|uniref:acyltransferase n=1 Tax=Citromicrobium bathyomarinum TaxID=72174 RepID=UPI00315AB476
MRAIPTDVGSPEDASPYRKTSWPLGGLRRLAHRARLLKTAAGSHGQVTWGSHVAIARGSDIRPPHFCRVGHHVSFGKNFTCEADLEVGNYVLVSSNVSVIGKDHPFDDPNRTVFTQPRVDDSVVKIGSDVLIGYGTIIVGSVTIGDGCIIGAGSVVVKDLPPYTVCVGNPARPIRSRYPANADLRMTRSEH